MISVEISPTCSFRCPNCNMQKRLHLDKTKDNKDIVRKIIKYVPKKSHLNFVGLGEPLIPLGQKRISEILKKRLDIKGFIQTNGSFKINKELISLIKKGRLEIGMSYDAHHIKGKIGSFRGKRGGSCNSRRVSSQCRQNKKRGNACAHKEHLQGKGLFAHGLSRHSFQFRHRGWEKSDFTLKPFQCAPDECFSRPTPGFPVLWCSGSISSVRDSVKRRCSAGDLSTGTVDVSVFISI